MSPTMHVDPRYLYHFARCQLDAADRRGDDDDRVAPLGQVVASLHRLIDAGTTMIEVPCDDWEAVASTVAARADWAERAHFLNGFSASTLDHLGH